LLLEPTPENDKTDDVNSQKPSDNAVGHHQRKCFVDANQIYVDPEEDKNDGEVEPHKYAV
jgi:hypothetical protein